MAISNVMKIVLIHCVISMKTRDVQVMSNNFAHYSQRKFGLIMNNIQLKLLCNLDCTKSTPNGNPSIRK